MFRKWLRVLIKPKETFRKEKNNADGVEAIKMIGFAGIITGVIYAIIFMLFDSPMVFFGSHGFGGKALYGVVMILFMPLYTILHLAILSTVLYVFAKFFGYKGNLTTQTYLIALFAAPLMVIYMSAAVLPHGMIIALIAILYFLYLLILALKEIYG